MKTLVKILLLLSLTIFLCEKFFDYVEHRKQKQKDPWLHVGCKLAYTGKMGGKSCEMCLSRYNARNQKILTRILVKWEKVRGKPPTTEADLNELLQIMKNYGIGDVFYEKD